MNYQQLPVTSDPNQTFQSTLSIDGQNRTLAFSISFNEQAGYWVMTVTDPVTGNALLDSVPLLPDIQPDPNILSQQAYLAIGSCYVINASNTADEYPTEDNLGSDFIVVWGNTPND
jgi:hypothetical protein